MATAQSSSSTPQAQVSLVLGVLSNERRPHWRERLRQYYAPFADRVRVRFVLDERWLLKHGPPAEDEVGVPVGRVGDQHCAHKMIGWWSIAQRWPAAFYAKTDDDALLDLGRMLPLLASLPSSRLYAGILRYSSINESTLEGVCWASGAFGALRRRRQCPQTRGPIVFAEGPFVVMSSDVQSWVAPRLAVDERQRCHFEDLCARGKSKSRRSVRH